MQSSKVGRKLKSEEGAESKGDRDSLCDWRDLVGEEGAGCAGP